LAPNWQAIRQEARRGQTALVAREESATSWIVVTASNAVPAFRPVFELFRPERCREEDDFFPFEIAKRSNKMSSLPAAPDFPSMEEEICRQWQENGTFRKQDQLSLERGDPVRVKNGSFRSAIQNLRGSARIWF
jgi:hypothetical protein